MIKPILRDIRAVGGVTGVVVLRKRDGFTEHIFPAAFSEDHFKQLYEMLVGAYRGLRGFSRLNLTFERVTIHVFSQNEFLLLVTTQPEVDQRVFEMVVKSKLSALERMLDMTPIIGENTPETSPQPAADGAPLQAILAVLNELSDRLIAETGRARVTHCWWEARKATPHAPDVLTQFSVDPNGHWAIRKGGLRPRESEAGRALAKVTELLLEKLGNLQPVGREALQAIISRHHDHLEGSCFLQHLKSYRPGKVKTHR
jgi:hypothetical protein